jgi:hypothetical protein
MPQELLEGHALPLGVPVQATLFNRDAGKRRCHRLRIRPEMESVCRRNLRRRNLRRLIQPTHACDSGVRLAIRDPGGGERRQTRVADRLLEP